LINSKPLSAVSQESIRQLAEQAALQAPLTTAERADLYAQAKTLLKSRNAVLVAHYYTDPDLQRLADETGGHVADSLDMARFGHDHPASNLVVAGVRFMGETAKILNPEKRVLMPTLEAECSLDLSCPADAFSQFCDAHPDRTVVVYANTSARVKARADWVVTSGIAVDVVTHLASRGEKLIWAPDKYLGEYVQDITGADMLLWQGSCVVHENFKVKELAELREAHPEAAILVHPESPPGVIALADVVGSTTGLIKAAKRLPNREFIVATDNAIFYKMQQAAPDKTFIEAPNAGIGATCMSCAHCPWMAMNSLKNLVAALQCQPGDSRHEIQIDPEIGRQAMVSLQRMLNFSSARKPHIAALANV